MHSGVAPSGEDGGIGGGVDGDAGSRDVETGEEETLFDGGFVGFEGLVAETIICEDVAGHKTGCRLDDGGSDVFCGEGSYPGVVARIC